MKKTKENQLGITMIALIVTVIVLLILAGISIATLNGDSGIIKKSKEAKEQTEISEEKEVVDRATVQAMGNNKKGDLIESELQEQLDKIASSGKTEVTDTGEEFEVLFKESNRYYTIDKEGKISDSKEIIKDMYPGDISRGKDGEILDGSKEQPYEIWCIEDLVAFSNIVNGNGIKFENGQSVQIKYKENFSNKYVEIKQDLNFKSKLSYANSERTDFGNINGIAEDSNTLINEMTTGTGFTPIGDTNAGFGGIFSGNNNKIKEIYINREANAGLFGMIASPNIKNVEISGNIIATGEEGNAGSICGKCFNVSAEGNIENCINRAKINGSSAGGIIGNFSSSPKTLKISNCINTGDITGSFCSGGIMGYAHTKTMIVNCCNSGQIVMKLAERS